MQLCYNNYTDVIITAAKSFFYFVICTATLTVIDVKNSFLVACEESFIVQATGKEFFRTQASRQLLSRGSTNGKYYKTFFPCKQ